MDKKKAEKNKRRTEIEEKAISEAQEKKKRKNPPLYTKEEIVMLYNRLQIEQNLGDNPTVIKVLYRQLREAGEDV